MAFLRISALQNAMLGWSFWFHSIHYHVLLNYSALRVISSKLQKLTSTPLSHAEKLALICQNFSYLPMISIIFAQ